MKKSILLVVLFLAYNSINAQKMDFWLDTGIKVQYGGSMLFNSAVGDDDNWDYTITTSSKLGGKFGINWNYTGISLDVMFGTLKGKFQNTSPTGGPDHITKVGAVDAYLLFRDARQKGYFEIGPKMSFIGEVKSEDGPGTAQDVTELYNSKAFAGVVGFGTYILGNDGRFSGILGLRFEYGFQDLVNDSGRAAGETRQPVNYVGDASSTVPIFAGLVFELNWGIGGVGQARCGEKSKFIWF
jgi:hypothetical protein